MWCRCMVRALRFVRLCATIKANALQQSLLSSDGSLRKAHKV